jgi:alanine racemase
MSIKDVKTGQFIGYGISYLAQTDIKTALIPIGYSSGYSRSLSNKGRLIIRGQRCSVIGVVNMNMIIADISNIPDAEIGDKVVIIGKQGELEIKVSAFSNNVDMLNYEILAHLPSNIRRKVICPDEKINNICWFVMLHAVKHLKLEWCFFLLQNCGKLTV